MDLTTWNAILDTLFSGNPSVPYYNVFGSQIGAGTNPQQQFIAGQVGNAQNQFLGQLPGNPNRTFQQFLQTFNPLGQWQNMSPRQRGENPGLYAPQVKYAANPFGL